MDLMSNPFFSFVLIVIGFGFLIFVHELGHFLVAKMVGIKTTQFAIGFGHSLLTWRKGLGFRSGTTEPEYEKLLAEGADPATLGETEYRLNYIPLGGYVKMLGQEDMDPTAQSSDPRAFNNKSISARFAVISAGVIMNVIFGMIFFVIAFMSGVKFPPAIVGAIAPGSPAATSYAQGHGDDPAYLGLRVDDRITHIDGKEIDDMMDIKYATILARGGSALELSVEREDEARPLTYLIEPEENNDHGLLWIGIDVPTSLEVGKVFEDSEIDTAGVRKGMFITAVNEQAVGTFGKYSRAVAEAQGREVVVTFTDLKSGDAVDVNVSAIPKLIRQDDTPDNPDNLMGLVPPVQIAAVMDKSPAQDAGVEPGDVVVSVEGLTWPDLAAFQQAVKDAQDKAISLTVLRGGEEVTLEAVTPKKGRIGVAIASATDSPFVSHALADSPAQGNSPIVRGSRLISANGEAIDSWGDLQRILGGLNAVDGGAELVLDYELNLADSPREQATIRLTAEDIEQIANAGWIAPLPDGMPMMTLQESVVGDDPVEAMALGLTKTHQFITQTYMTLVRLTQGTVPADKLSGPVGIVHQGTIIAERGWEYLLYFLGLISINLAVINFLPIPITDGGQAVFLAAEKVKGSPVSVKVQTAATLVGLALLGCVFLFVTYNDILRLVGPS